MLSSRPCRFVLIAAALVLANSYSIRGNVSYPQSATLDDARRLNQQVVSLYQAGRYDEALPLAHRVLEIREKILGSDHPDVAAALNNLAALYERKGDLSRAEPLYQRVLTIREKALGPDHPDVAKSLINLAEIYDKKGDFAHVIPLYQRALAVTEKNLGSNHPDVATVLNDLAAAFQESGDLNSAEPLYVRAIAIREKSLGPDNADVARSLSNLALLYIGKQDYVRAEPLYKRAIGILEKSLGADSPDVAMVANNLGDLYRLMGNFGQAELFLNRGLSIREKNLGSNHPLVAESLINLGNLNVDKGDYARAEPAYKRGLDTLEKTVGPNHPYVGKALGALAKLYILKGDYLTPEALYQRVVSIFEKTLGPEHPEVASALNNLAGLYDLRGDYVQAEQLLQRVLSIREKTLGPNNPEFAMTLSNLAQIYEKRGDPSRAEPMYSRARLILENALGPDHPALIGLLSNLAELYMARGDVALAEPVLQHALRIGEKTLGPEHPDVALLLNNLGKLYLQKEDYANAEATFRSSEVIYEKVLGIYHPNLSAVLNNLSELYVSKGDISGAIAAQTRATDISERNLKLVLTSGSETEKLLYAAALLRETNTTVSLHLHSAPTNREAARLALTTILRRKGRVLDAVSNEFAALRRRLNPQDQALLERLAKSRSQLSSLVLSGPFKPVQIPDQAVLNKIEIEVRQLENEISSRARSDELRTEVLPVSLAQVQQAIPEDGVLVEFISYRPYNEKAKIRADLFDDPHYAAYILRRTSDPQWVELGKAAPTNTLISQVRSALRNPQRTDIASKSRNLDEAIMRPIRKILGNVHHILLSPDGDLNLIPFAALVDEHGKYLIEEYSINYLTSGRDLLRFPSTTKSRQAAVVIANPSFDVEPSKSSDGKTPLDNVPTKSRSSDLKERFQPLRGTDDEAKELARILGVQPLTGASATETSLKKLHGPLILHVATHGFFLPNQMRPKADELKNFSFAGSPLNENPLLRSGLALAGANQRLGGDGEDGILTSLETAGLDLWGTKLVVLSACDTGLGDVQNGEGVYGLRRALVLAGAESEVISLWKVNDEVTRDFMTAYYGLLKTGQGKGEAVRKVQLGLLRDKRSENNRSHPYFWAAFIESGDWRSLIGQ